MQEVKHARLALVFVVLSLLALVAIPLHVQRLTDRARTVVEDVSEPARTEVTRLQYWLSRGMSALRGYLLTGEESFLTTYSAAKQEEQRAWEVLEPLTLRLGPAVIQRYAETRALSKQWHQRVEDDSMAVRGTAPVSERVRSETEQHLFNRVIGESARLDSVLVEAARAQRQTIQSVERKGMLLTALLGLLALAAAAAVGYLGLRIRELAAEAEEQKVHAQRALARIKSADESRARLLRGVTHDIKNPLGAADGYATLLQLGVKGGLSSDQVQVVDGIRRSIGSALDIIGALLDLSRAETGALPVQHSTIDLPEAVADMVADHEPMATSMGHVLVFAQPTSPLLVQSDPARVAQILGNLLTNAIKYTEPPGRIAVAIERGRLDDAPSVGDWTAVRVTDTGPGIREADIIAVFDEFTRLESASDTKGHGLGLPISRRIARMLDGDVTVRSALGIGSTFTLWLPMGR